MITHDQEIARAAPRRVHLHDGRIQSDSAAEAPVP
jgi:ABC-type lipoprotein export system ATPase subunit